MSTTRRAVQAGGATSSIGAKYASELCSSSRGTGSAKSANERRQSPSAGSLRLARAHVGVAVDSALAQRDREERATLAEHDGPIGELGEAVGEEAPRRLSHVAGRGTAEREASDRRMDAVGADDEVVAVARPVGEGDPGRRAVLELGHRGGEAHRRLRGRLAQRLVERLSPNRDAISDPVPPSLDVDLGETTAPMIEETLLPDRVGVGRQRRRRALSGPARRCPAGTGRPRSAASRIPARRPRACPHAGAARGPAKGRRSRRRRSGSSRRYAPALSSRSRFSIVCRTALSIARRTTVRSSRP